MIPQVQIRRGGIKKGTPMPRYNWDVLKLEFIRGPWETLEDFKRNKGMPLGNNSPYMTNKMKGWRVEKMRVLAEATKEAAKNLVKDKTKEIEKVKERQVKTARFLQTKGIKALEKLNPVDAEEARKMILTGMQEERNILGISEKGGQPSNLTQVNVNLPKTKFDEIINEQDFAGILRFIADIRRERVRRIGESASSGSQTEISQG